MNIDIFAEFDNNGVALRLSLPFDFLEKNSEEYTNLENKIIYKSNNLTIDNNILNNELNNLLPKIKKFFYEDKVKIENKNLNIHIIDGEYNKEAFNFIKNNKNLNIVISLYDFKEIIDFLKDDEYPNLKINFKNSDECISYKDFYNMYNMLNEITKFINHYNLSPLEKVMLVYDIVKSNEYKKEDNNESYGSSRNLNEIINNDKIVCVGFSNLMDFLLKNLNIASNTMIIGYTDKKNLHERNFLHLKDDKYKIDGIFFLDATWDSKRNEEYLNNYTFFLKPFNFFKNYKNTEYIVSPTKFQILEKNKNELEEYVKKTKNSDFIRFSLTLTQLIKEYDSSVGIMIDLKNKSTNEIMDIIFKSKASIIKIFLKVLLKMHSIE